MTAELNNQALPENQKNAKLHNFKNWAQQHHSLIKQVVFGILLILSLLSVTRIPYVGVFLDSVFFSFIWGYAKYVIYLYIVYYCVINIIKLKYKPLFSKRYLLACLLLASCLSILFGGIEITVNNLSDSINYYCKNVWYETIFNFNTPWVFGKSGYIDGGIIGAIVSSITGIFVIILALVLMLLIIILCFSPLKKWMINKFFSKWAKKYSDNYQTFSEQFKQSNSNQQDKNSKLENDSSILAPNKQLAFSLDDNYVKHDIDIKKYQYDLLQLLKENKINCAQIKVDETDQEYRLKFYVEEDQIKLFEATEKLLNLIFDNVDYHIINYNNDIIIKIQKVSSSINPILKKYLDIKIKNENDFVLCFSEKYQPIYFNMNNNNVIGISSENDSDYYGYLNALASQLSINYDKQYLKMYFVSPLGINQKVLISQNTAKNKVDNLKSLNKFIDLLIEQIQNIEAQYQKYDVDNIISLNQKTKERYKHHFIFIDHIDFLMQNQPDLFNKLHKLIKQSHRYGISFIIIDHSQNLISNNQIVYDCILGIDVSRNVAKNIVGLNVNYKNIMFIPMKKQKYSIIFPKMNQKELSIVENKLISILNNLDE